MEPAHFRLDYRSTIRYYAAVINEAQAKGPEAVRMAEKHLGATDLFYLLGFVLTTGPLIMHPWLFDRCREVQRSPNGHLDLWAREHFKSTIITFGMTIQDIINDPEITIGIFSHSKPVAKKFLTQIKQEMEGNKNLPRLWPEIFWDNPKGEAPKWSEDVGIIVKRKGNPKEATVEAHGLVDGQPTGRHFKGRIYDDVVTIESVNTAEQIIKTTNAWRISDNLGSIGGWVRYIGTRYHLFDTYRTMLDDKVAIPRIHAATEDGTEFGKPVFMPQKVLSDKRRNQGPFIFSAQMLLDPTADKAMGFRLEWLDYADIEYNAAMRQLWRFIIVDPAGGKQRKNNDYTTMWVIGHGEDGKFRLLDCVRDRLSLSGRGEALMALHRKWKPHLVAYEEYGMQADIEFVKFLQKRDLYEFEITPLGGHMRKELRILRLVPLFENGYKDITQGGDGISKSRIILPTSIRAIDYQGQAHDLIKDFIEQEYTAFPVLSHDDMLDCLARLCDLLEMGVIEKPKIVIPAEHNRIIDGLRNIETSNTGADSWLTA